MTGKRDVTDYLHDILDATGAAEQFLADMEYEDFATDRKTVFAVIHALEIVGEAAKQVPGPLRQEYSAVPRREIAGMRDKLIHEYFGVRLKYVFETVRVELPPLRAAVAIMLDDLERER